MTTIRGVAVLVVIAILMLLLAGWLTLPANAQEPQCAPRDMLIGVLAEKYGETPHGAGLINEKAMLEVFVSKRGTFTIAITNEQGIACVMAAGDAWEDETDFKAGGSI